MKEQIIIRLIKPEDNHDLAQMIRAVFDEHSAPKMGTIYSDPTTDNLFQLFTAPKSVLWVAEIDNEIVGSCGIYPTEGLDGGTTELVKYYLLAKCRGKGIGKSLMKKTIKSTVEFGYTKIYLESLPQFSNAVSMYEKQGFKTLSNPLGNSGHPACNIWMLREL
jgi:putative acetyltransferase